MSHTNVKLTGQTLRHIQWNAVIHTSVCILLLVTNDSPVATPFRITWPSEDHWGDLSYQCEAYWTNLASHTMKCCDTHVSMYIIISYKRLNWDDHTLQNHVTLRRPLGWCLIPMWSLLDKPWMKCSDTHVSMYIIISNKRLTWDDHTLQNHVTLRRPLGRCLIPMWSLLDKPCVTYNEM